MKFIVKTFGVVVLLFVMAHAASLHYAHIGIHNQVIRGDGKGYYAYLPAVFVYHDNQMNFIDYYEHKYNDPYSYAEFRYKAYGKYVDKYYAGLAIMQLPFFLMAHYISLHYGLPADGYAPLYQQFFVAGGFFYLLLGMQALLLFLLSLNVKPIYAWLAVFFVLFATNCYHYAVYEQCMTHIYNLSLICIFIYGAHRIIHARSRWWIAIITAVLGFIVVLRPTNALILLFIPFIAGNMANLKAGIRFVLAHYGFLLAGMAVAAVPVCIQSALWYWQTGHFYVYSYGWESMDWTNPKIYHILFSYNSGWFLWSPFAMLGIFGLFVFLPDRFRFWSIIGFTFIIIYTLSSWWTADYGWRFGSRVFIDFLFLPAIGFVMVMQNGRSSLIKIELILLSFMCFGINQVQAFQYRKEIIRWDSMPQKSYWRVFMQTDSSYYYWLNEKRSFDPQFMLEKNIDKSFFYDVEHPAGWTSDGHITDKFGRSANHSYVLDSLHKFGPAFKYTLTDDILKKDSLVQASLWFYGPHPEDTRLVIRYDSGDKRIEWKEIKFRIYVDEDYTWTRAVFQLPIPKEMKPGNTVECFAYNGSSKRIFYLDDFRMDFIKKQQCPI